jgi:hypothetical protein
VEFFWTYYVGAPIKGPPLNSPSLALGWTRVQDPPNLPGRLTVVNANNSDASKPVKAKGRVYQGSLGIPLPRSIYRLLVNLLDNATIMGSCNRRRGLSWTINLCYLKPEPRSFRLDRPLKKIEHHTESVRIGRHTRHRSSSDR